MRSALLPFESIQSDPSPRHKARMDNEWAGSLRFCTLHSCKPHNGSLNMEPLFQRLHPPTVNTSDTHLHCTLIILKHPRHCSTEQPAEREIQSVTAIADTSNSTPQYSQPLSAAALRIKHNPQQDMAGKSYTSRQTNQACRRSTRPTEGSLIGGSSYGTLAVH